MRRRMMMQSGGGKGAKYISATGGAYINLNGSGYRTPFDIYFRMIPDKYIQGTLLEMVSTDSTNLGIGKNGGHGISLWRQVYGEVRLIPATEHPTFTFNQQLAIINNPTKNNVYWCRLDVDRVSYPQVYRNFPTTTCTFIALRNCNANVRLERIVQWNNAHTTILADWNAENVGGEWGMLDAISGIFNGNSAGVGEIVGGFEPN